MIRPTDAEPLPASPLPQPPKGWHVTPQQWADICAEHDAAQDRDEAATDARLERQHERSLRGEQ